MKDMITHEYRYLVFENNGQPVTTSLKVAEKFGKRHADVLRAVRNLDCSPEFAERNFAFCYENNELQNGKPRPLFTMTKDGFIFLVFGFTGKSAGSIKELFINAFNWMADQLFGGMKNTYRQLAVVERKIATLNANASEGGRQMALKRWHVKPLQLECDRLWQKAQPMLPHI